MQQPMISVCVPTYNGEKYLRECLDGILAQTYSGFELIIVDDRSSDATISIIEEYVKQDQRIVFLKNEKNLGLVGNWNKCLELAKGEWVKFIFQDDLVEPDCLEKQLNAAQGHDMVVSDRGFVFDQSVPESMKLYYNETMLSFKKLVSLQNTEFIPARQISQFAVNHMALNFVGEPTCVMFRKKLVHELGVFNDDLAQICDLEYWLRIGTLKGMVYMPEKLVKFRIHAGSTTSSNVITEKKFRPVFIDPMLLANELLFQERFAAFRTYISSAQLKKLDLYILSKMYEAKKAFAKDQKMPKNYMDELIKKYRTLEDYFKPSLFSRIVYAAVLFRRKLKSI